MSIRTHEFIQKIRNCKTSSDERYVISKESALIRTSFKNDESEYRARNISKIIFIHLMGYPTHFAQIECLKLIASNNYGDKRIGYLAAMLLIDENHEVITLLTNSLKNDLSHPNQMIVGLALTTLANISSAEMARDCAPEVEKLLDSKSMYIRKKANLAAIRILRKAPDLLESFVPYIKKSMKYKNHGVLITTTALIIEICTINPSAVKLFTKLVPHLIRVYNDLLQYSFSQDYDVGGITDPFLQVKLLRLLRILGHNNFKVSDTMNMLLASIATNTDSAKNVGNSVLYECVNTIMGIESQSDLRILAINILGRFLSNKDNNIRYVALNTLCNVVSVDNETVQRHRNMIVECLKDPDISIRRRALELTYALINHQNVQKLVKELIHYLSKADINFRSDLTARLCIAIEKFSPRATWYIDTILKVMQIAGNYVPQQTAWNLISLVSSDQNLSAYTVQKVYLYLSNDISQKTLVQVGSWLIGEFGEYLLVEPIQLSEQHEDEEQIPNNFKVNEDNIIELFKNILRSPITSFETKCFVLNAIAKLTVRFKSQHHIDELNKILKMYNDHINVELQQRSVEYSKILEYNLHKQLLSEKIPPIESDVLKSTSIVKSPLQTPKSTNHNTLDNLLDLNITPSNITQTEAPLKQNEDLLLSLFGSPSSQPNHSMNITDILTPNILQPQQQTNKDNNFNLLKEETILQPQTIKEPKFDPIIAFQNEDISIRFEFIKPQPHNLQNTIINSTITNINANSSLITNLDIKVSLPKYIKYQLSPTSSNTISKESKVTQQLKLSNTLHGSKPVALRLRVVYNVNDQPKTFEFLVENLPKGL